MRYQSKGRDLSVQSLKKRKWNNSWALTALLGQCRLQCFLFLVPARSWVMLSAFATQMSEERVFWCALVVPGGVQTWLWCLSKQVVFFCRTEILVYAKVPQESSVVSTLAIMPKTYSSGGVGVSPFSLCWKNVSESLGFSLGLQKLLRSSRFWCMIKLFPSQFCLYTGISCRNA